MAYKTGDKFVIEIDSVMTNKNGTLYGIKGFKSLVFDDYGLEQLERIPGENEFRVGDIIRFKHGVGRLGTITRVSNGMLSILWNTGEVETWIDTDPSPFVRTGLINSKILEWVSNNDRN